MIHLSSTYFGILNFPILYHKSSDFLRDRDRRTESQCTVFIFARSVIDSIHTHSSMKRSLSFSSFSLSSSPIRTTSNPISLAALHRDHGPFGTLIKYLKYQYCFTLTFEYVIVLEQKSIKRASTCKWYTRQFCL